MSALIIYGVDLQGNTYAYSSLKNSWGGAIKIWQFLGNKYFPKPEDLEDLSGFEYNALNMEYLKKIWSLQSREDIPLCERALLFTTFDGCMCKKEYLLKLADLFDEASPEVDKYLPDWKVDHIKNQAQIFRQAAVEENLTALCWQQTSVAESKWHEYNTTNNEYHWYMAEEIFSIK